MSGSDAPPGELRHNGVSEKFPYSAFCEVDQLQRLQLSHNSRRYRLPFWSPLPIGVGLWRSSSPINIVVLLRCLPGKSPRESPPLPLWAITHEEEDHGEP